MYDERNGSNNSRARGGEQFEMSGRGAARSAGTSPASYYSHPLGHLFFVVVFWELYSLTPNLAYIFFFKFRLTIFESFVGTSSLFLPFLFSCRYRLFIYEVRVDLCFAVLYRYLVFRL